MIGPACLVLAAHRYPLPDVAAVGLLGGLAAQYPLGVPDLSRLILLATLLAAGLPVIAGTLRRLLHGNFAADIMASLAIVGVAITGEYLAGCIIVLVSASLPVGQTS